MKSTRQSNQHPRKGGASEHEREKEKSDVSPQSLTAPIPPRQAADDPTEADRIVNADAVAWLAQLPAQVVDLAFADPPFNIGYEYDVYHDSLPDDDYLAWCRSWMLQLGRVVKPTGSIWLAIGDEYAAEFVWIAKRELRWVMRNWVIWYYTFGVNCKKKFSRSHTHLLHFVLDEKQAFFDTNAVRVPSARQSTYADARANPAGRLPDNTWILRPQDLPPWGFGIDEDTIYQPRVAGTFKERKGFHGCQMPERVLERIIRTCTQTGDQVLDPFVGSGTTMAVAKKLGRTYLGCDLSATYVEMVHQRLRAIHVGDPITGPENPLASAPPTKLTTAQEIKATKAVKRRKSDS